MAASEITREIQADGSVVVSDARCRFIFERIGHGVMEVKIAGIDNGQLGTAPLDELSMALVRERPLELFIDATEASMPAVKVSREWTRFFARNQGQGLTKKPC